MVKEAAKNGSLITLLVTIVGLSVTVGLAGWFLGAYLGADFFPAMRNNQETSKVGGVALDAGEEAFSKRLFLLPPIITDIAAKELTDNHKIWIRLRVGVVLKIGGGGLDRRTVSEITNNFLSYIRTMTLRELHGAIGLRHLKEDLLERANVLSNGRVAAIVIPTFVVE
ncbi:flagellar basal body-associated FliL family protein [Bartonella sp. TP]|uniref:flagellar basal body-associated FliL family protein n=1 Tax=Bartonella sp. TP TaxID=3057550 RepID=UPI0025AEEEFC|nr:flagellar basal body-associated FliL family protein [Bartonella sp. TP]WJW80270.1 flagellar basal body-associated FliL family protein [Bartonella sp. TP]